MRRTHRLCLGALFCLLAAWASPVPSFSQLPGSTVAPAVTEIPKHDNASVGKVTRVSVNANLLSVELDDAQFGNVLHSIGQQVGFAVEISGDASFRKISTKFENIEVDKGISRLLSLLGQKNYLMRYDTNGVLSKVKIYNESSIAGQVQAARLPAGFAPRRPALTPAVQQTPVVPVRPSVDRPPVPQPRIMQRPAQSFPDDQEAQNTDNSALNESAVEETPYVPANKRPVFVPARGQ